MNRVGIFACAGSGIALAALAWFLSDTPGALSGISNEMVSRSAGVALLGIALVAAGLMLHAAMRADQKSTSATSRPQAREYRRGFGRKPQRQRAVVEQMLAAVEISPTLPRAEIERLQEILRNRTARTIPGNHDMAKRPFLRSGVDHHGLSPW